MAAIPAGFTMKTEQPEQILERWLIEYRGLMLRVARSFASGAVDEEDLLQEIAGRTMELDPAVPF